MTYREPNHVNQRKAIATGAHNGKHFKLIASYDAISDLYVVHVYVSDELLNPYSRQTPSDNSFKKVEFSKDHSSIEQALDAGDAAAIAHIDSH